jgi:hypothetical protein
MSDAPAGPGWWQASDGKWYPPETRPQWPPVPDATPAPDGAPSTPGSGTPYGASPTPPPGTLYPGAPGAPYPGPQPGMPPPGPYYPGPGPYPMAPPPSQGMSGCLKAFLIGLAVAVVLGIGGCVAIVFVARDAADDFVEETESERRDIGEIDCHTDASGFMVADVEITNHTSKSSNYILSVSFVENGSVTTSSSAFLDNLPPGSTGTAPATTSATPTGSDFTCQVDSVQRFSAEG